MSRSSLLLVAAAAALTQPQQAGAQSVSCQLSGITPSGPGVTIDAGTLDATCCAAGHTIMTYTAVKTGVFENVVVQS